MAKIDSKRLLIAVYDGFSKPLNAEIRKLESAINQHNKKAEKQVAQVKDAKATIRAEQEKEFASNVEEVKGLLIQSGIKEANFFTGRSLFGGAVVFVKLPNGGVITINKSSAELLRKAKLAAKKAE